MQQLGLDLSRVYRRFKMLELGESEEKLGKKKKRGERRSGDNDRGVKAIQDALQDTEIKAAYENLKKGIDFLEGEEKVKAYAIMKDIEEKQKEKRKEKGRKKSMTPESEEKLGKIGKELNAIEKRLNEAE
ncbi:hypothetical protein TL16_g04589 [Triparma laevis f. inornata]|uniref:Uncharacterized protein n=1 Tax=Triparma laevis f. inornata TaxID=1714386 RepID=A0A9W7A7A8_9STRA|nr:hypothetical protein TL16_g04589 [Triparma laevis f. inornata]